LIHLYKGIEFSLKSGKKVFLQVRLIVTSLDTKAVSEIYNMQAQGSYSGCGFCNSGHGMRIDTPNCKGGQVVYVLDRDRFHEHHALRYIGQSQNCCPPNYYSVVCNPKAKLKDNSIDVHSLVTIPHPEDTSGKTMYNASKIKRQRS
jgi:hypothetical protein